MGEFPTLKQENFARDIAVALNIELPSMRTKQAYSNFINEHINEFKRSKQRYGYVDEDMASAFGNCLEDIL